MPNKTRKSSEGNILTTSVFYTQLIARRNLDIHLSQCARHRYRSVSATGGTRINEIVMRSINPPCIPGQFIPDAHHREAVICWSSWRVCYGDRFNGCEYSSVFYRNTPIVRVID